MLKIGSIRFRGKCTKHPSYDPYLDGPGGIRGGCDRCALLLEIMTRHTELLALMKRFAPPHINPNRNRRETGLQASLFGEFTE